MDFRVPLYGSQVLILFGVLWKIKFFSAFEGLALDVHLVLPFLTSHCNAVLTLRGPSFASKDT